MTPDTPRRRFPRRTLPIRGWLALALVAVIAVPVIASAFSEIILRVLVYQDTWTSPGERAVSRLLADADRWSDPAWQVETRTSLAATGIEFVLSEGNREIFRSSADPVTPDDLDSLRVIDRAAVSGSGPERVALVYADEHLWYPAFETRWVIPLAALISLMLTVLAIAWFLGRTVVRPLAAASQSLRHAATGDLDLALPTSRVREIAHLTAALQGMSDELRASLHHQAELEQERRLFISAIAHDLRTPLFSLRGYLSGLTSGIADTPAKTAHYLSVAEEKADALERLVADLFAYTRLEYLDQSPVREPLDLNALVTDLVAHLVPRADAHQIRLVVTSTLPCPVDGDAYLLTRAIENLLDNALRYTPAGGTIQVRCGNRPHGTTAFTVNDSGPGIAAVDLPHLFTPLYRGDASRSRKTGGAGLGLTIARRILVAHGGDLVAANAPGGGATFTGSLPTRNEDSLDPDKRWARGTIVPRAHALPSREIVSTASTDASG